MHTDICFDRYFKKGLETKTKKVMITYIIKVNNNYWKSLNVK
ncbi:hypothetical protein HMPREF9554_00881 [Treponema phagedenis F0421]|nr:hypothetical protein HMPREF9554_00881 [Treponema phagedenis F0421]